MGTPVIITVVVIMAAATSAVVTTAVAVTSAVAVAVGTTDFSFGPARPTIEERPGVAQAQEQGASVDALALVLCRLVQR